MLPPPNWPILREGGDGRVVTWWHNVGPVDAGSIPGRGAVAYKTWTTFSLPFSTSSIIWYQLGGKQAHHATHWLPVRGLAASTGLWPKTDEPRDQRRLMGLTGAGRCFTLLYVNVLPVTKPTCQSTESLYLIRKQTACTAVSFC